MCVSAVVEEHTGLLVGRQVGRNELPCYLEASGMGCQTSSDQLQIVHDLFCMYVDFILNKYGVLNRVIITFFLGKYWTRIPIDKQSHINWTHAPRSVVHDTRTDI